MNSFIEPGRQPINDREKRIVEVLDLLSNGDAL